MLKGYDFGGQTYCEACRPSRAKKVILAEGEWFVCGTCSFAVGLLEAQRKNMLKPVLDGTREKR